MYLVKVSDGDVQKRDTFWELLTPRVQAGVAAPVAGDLAFLWTHETGLIAEVSFCDPVRGNAEKIRIVPRAIYHQPYLRPEWLADADREKTTIRSKLKCYRHSRIWGLSDDEVDELDRSRRERAIPDN
ncbi:hypothetical protein CLV78_102248 [Aliiruegeria haliotis]|uniref:Uncharacterized protein n=1 Tax=Aliiruegeria haliotis TaxID=1280846 RepID=A0A2T0RV59_9RHOB|nr:hypothetical protein [Aliiruegeria haliotis]PRY25071.1 hypothetical protein CLV78_102248 [Aliiruegeria haliotis]